MSRYRKIQIRMWGDQKFRLLSPLPPCGQGLWLYLLTGPHTGPIPGLFRVGRAAMAEDLGWDLGAFDKAFQEAFRLGMVKADWNAKLVWIPNAIHHNRPESPNVVKSWATEWDLLPECDLKWEACQALKASMEALGSAYARAFAAVIQKPSGKAFGKTTVKTFGKLQQRHEKDQNSVLPTELQPQSKGRLVAPELAPESHSGEFPEMAGNGQGETSGKPSPKPFDKPGAKAMANQEQEQEQYSLLESKTNNTDISVGMLSASGLETASQLSEPSFPDSTVHVQDVSDERRKGVTTASKNAPSSSKLPDEIAMQESSPLSPCSPTHRGDNEKRKPLIRDHRDDSRSASRPSQQPAAQPAPDATKGGESLSDLEGAETTPAGPANEQAQPEFYLTRRRRKLSGWKLEAFNEFWQAFAYKKGRAEAADAWLDVPDLSRELAAKIIKAAEKEAKARPAHIAKGGAPKWGQGWLSGRRWEDWEENDADSHDQDRTCEPSDSDEDPYYSNYRRL